MHPCCASQTIGDIHELGVHDTHRLVTVLQYGVLAEMAGLVCGLQSVSTRHWTHWLLLLQMGVPGALALQMLLEVQDVEMQKVPGPVVLRPGGIRGHAPLVAAGIYSQV